MNKFGDKLINISDVYIVLWCIYLQQGAIFSSGGLLFQGLLLLLLLISGYYTFLVITKYKTPPYFIGLFWLLSVMSFYGIMQLFFGDTIYLRENGVTVQNFEYLKMLYLSLLPIYSFFVFGRLGYITERRIYFYVILFVVLAINSFYYSQARTLAERITSEEYEITNNTGYIFVSIIPLISLVKKDLLRFILLAVCLTFSFLSIKRGAITIGLVASFILLLQTLSSRQTKTKFVNLIFIIAIVVGIYFLANNLWLNNTYFQSRVDSTLSGTSGNRDYIYSDLWNHFLNDTPFMNQLFGNGAFATTRFAMNYAHSDWLEILIDNGILGIIIYIIYWALLFKTWRIAKMRCDSRIATSILLIMIIYFLKSIFSMSFNVMDIYATFAFGYCLSQVKYNHSISV